MKAFGRSPFPGMDPYLEGPVNWSDFHSTYIQALREAIGDQLPDRYFARVSELVMMVTPELPPRRSIEPDVLVGRDWRGAGDSSTRPISTAALLEPMTLANIELLDPYTEPLIEIIRLPEQDVVTVVELFSPTNKYGEGRGAYAEKRNRLMRTNVNIVELDLIRAGPRLRLSQPLPKDHYYCFVSRGDRRPMCDVYHWSVRQQLPMIPIPLAPPDPDVQVGLASAFEVAFARGKYGRFVDYAQAPPAPTFEEPDASWVVSIAQGS